MSDAGLPVVADAGRRDWPVLDLRCPKCRRFTPRAKTNVVVNGLDDVVESTGECARCGKVELDVIGWTGDDNE